MCSEEKYELPRGSINAVNENKWQITKHYPKKIPWLTSYFSEEYTVCHAGTTQPESAKFATHPKICHLYKPKAAAQKCSGLNKTKLAFDSSCKSIHVESLHDDEKY